MRLASNQALHDWPAEDEDESDYPDDPLERFRDRHGYIEP